MSGITQFMSGVPAVQLTGNDLTFEQLYDVALRGAKVSLAAAAIERMLLLVPDLPEDTAAWVLGELS